VTNRYFAQLKKTFFQALPSAQCDNGPFNGMRKCRQTNSKQVGSDDSEYSMQSVRCGQQILSYGVDGNGGWFKRHVCPIEWHQYQWPWVTLNVTLAVFKPFYLLRISQVLTMLCVYVNGKVSVVYNHNCFPKMKHFSRLVSQQAVTCTVKVVLSKKWCKIDTLLLHTTHRKYHIAYRFWPFSVTLDDLEVIHLCDISHDFNWHGASRGPLAIAELLV